MCLMCIEIAKGRMTVDEARRALPELVNADNDSKEHYLELQNSNDQELLKKAKQHLSEEK